MEDPELSLKGQNLRTLFKKVTYTVGQHLSGNPGRIPTSAKYGEDWRRFRKAVPYVWVPGIA